MTILNKILSKLCFKAINLGWNYHVKEQRKQFSIPNSVTFNAISLEGNVAIGEETYINDFSRIDSGIKSKVSIGKHCAIGRFVHITSKTHSLVRPTSDEENLSVFEEESDVTIGNYVWIGDKATILPGVTIGDYAIVAAHSVVMSSILPFEIVGGIPAKHIRFNDDHYRFKKIQ